MSASMTPYLQHILTETQYLLDRAQGLAHETFLRDETLKRAFVRSLEIIGEAVKQLPNDIKEKWGVPVLGGMSSNCGWRKGSV